MAGKFFEILFSIVMTFRWRWLIFYFCAFFAGSWLATFHFDPNADISSPNVYWWYFLNKVLGGLGGFNGYTPETFGARMVSLVLYIGGGIFPIATICRIVSTVHQRTQKKKKGLATLKMKNHIVLLGYRLGETEDVIEQLLADYQAFKPKAIVLCSKKIQEVPARFAGNEMVSFVHGDTSSDDVIERACIKDASHVVITGHEEARTIAVCISISNVVKADAHIVAHVEHQETVRFLHKINSKIECVMSLRTMLIAQAIVNPGSSSVFRDMVDLDNPPTIFRINIPEGLPGVPFSLLVEILHHCYEVIPIAVADDHTPDGRRNFKPKAGTMVKGGMSLFYIGEYRIDGNIDWKIFHDAQNIEGFSIANSQEVRESMAQAVPA